jgi:hypothetical protein
VEIAISRKIPLLDDEKFVGTRSLSTIEALFSRGLVTVHRNTKGFIVCARCVHVAKNSGEGCDQRMKAQQNVPAATRYSFKDTSIECRPWDLKRLNGARCGVHYAPAHVLPHFTAVVRSCLK